MFRTSNFSNEIELFISLKTIPKGFPYEKTNNGFTTFLLATAHCVSVIHNVFQDRKIHPIHWEDAQLCPIDMKSIMSLGSAMDN